MVELSSEVVGTASHTEVAHHPNQERQHIRCPCHDFQSIQSIYAAIVDNQESSKTEAGNGAHDGNFQRLIDWISGVYNERAHQERKRLNCYMQAGGQCCVHRAQVSSLILNGLHNSVRPFLQQQTCDGKGDRSSTMLKRQIGEPPPLVSNNDFPSLLQSVSSAGNLKSKARPAHSSATITTTVETKKSKRRIRPVLLNQDQDTFTGNLLNLPVVSEKQPSSIQELNRNAVPASVWNRKMSDPKPALHLNQIEKEPVMNATTPKKASILETKVDTSGKQDEAHSLVYTPHDRLRYQGKNGVHQSPNALIQEVVACPQINSIVATYTALIHSCLVPSTIVEIHWLLRLLAIAESTPQSMTSKMYESSNLPQPAQPNHVSFSGTMDSNDDAFSLILSSPTRCRYFAMASLRNQSILLQGLGLRIIHDLIHFPLLSQYLPDVTVQLKQYVEKYDLEITNVHSMIGSSIIHQTAHLTIPFKPERDSRHNFRTREGNAIYKNREECRDAFLFQLRTFLHLKGKMIDSTEASRVLVKLRHSSRVIINDLSKPNISWFAEVFTEMVLQIGHIPLQETDTELLQTVDKDKLQKLHRRFLSRAPLQSNSGKIFSKAIPVDPKRDVSTPPIVAAQQYFTGHQEFFFLFMMYADSYVFNIHLRMKFISMLKMILDDARQKLPTEKEILDARLLGRFLGVLLFSPNWQSLHEITINVSVIDELNQLAFAGLSIIESLNDAMKNGNLLLSVSWTVELLKMGKWDFSLKASPPYNRTIEALRSIQTRLASEVQSCQSRCQEFALVRNILESFFHEVVGLTQIVKLERASIPMMHKIKRETMPAISSGIISPDTSTVLAPQLEDLLSLIVFLSQSNSVPFRSPGISKKLRPSVVDPSTSFLHSPMAPSSLALQSGIVGPSDPTAITGLSGTSMQPYDSFLSTMRDNFFHNHGELKLICDFVAVRTLKNLRLEIMQRCIHPLISVDIEHREQAMMLGDKMAKSCKQYLSEKLENGIRDVVAILAPVETPSAVLDMGIALTAETLCRSGDVIVAGLVDGETTRMLHSIGSNQSKRLFQKDISESRIEQAKYYRNLSVMIDHVTENLDKLDENVHNVNAALTSLATFLKDTAQEESAVLPPEHSLRQLYFSVLKLDDHSDAVADLGTNDCLGRKEDRWTLLAFFIDVMIKLKRLSHRGLHRLNIRLSDEKFIATFIELGMEVTNTSAVSQILCQLLRAKVIRFSSLHEALLKCKITEPCSTELIVTIENLSSRT